MARTRARISGAALALLLATQVALPRPSHAFNDEYVFGTTKSLNETDMNTALKVTLIPATVILDVLFLPFAVVAGFVT